MFNAARPGLVGILTTQTVQGGGRTRRHRGFGFIVDADGYIVTSNHTVRETSAIDVTLADGRTLPVTLIGRDPLSDVAVLKVDAAGLPVIPLGSSRALKIGEMVVALGRPGGSEQVGTIRATGAAIGGNLAMSMSVAPNAAGGPIVNSRGEAVGIATSTDRKASATGFAVPIDRAKPILLELKARRSGAGGRFAAPEGVLIRPSDR